MIRLAKYTELSKISTLSAKGAIDAEHLSTIQLAFLLINKCVYVYEQNASILGFATLDPHNHSRLTNLVVIDHEGIAPVAASLIMHIATLPENATANCISLFTDMDTYDELQMLDFSLSQANFCVKPTTWEKISYVRKACTTDIEALAQLKSEFLTNPAESLFYQPDQLEWEVERDLEQIYLAEINNEIVGYLQITRHAVLHNCMNLTEIYVKPEYRNRKYARSMIATAFSDAAKHKRDLVFISVYPDQQAMLSLLKNLKMECSSFTAELPLETTSYFS